MGVLVLAKDGHDLFIQYSVLSTNSVPYAWIAPEGN